LLETVLALPAIRQDRTALPFVFPELSLYTLLSIEDVIPNITINVVATSPWAQGTHYSTMYWTVLVAHYQNSPFLVVGRRYVTDGLNSNVVDQNLYRTAINYALQQETEEVVFTNKERPLDKEKAQAFHRVGGEIRFIEADALSCTIEDINTLLDILL
jgi:hypothetical protein